MTANAAINWHPDEDVTPSPKDVETMGMTPATSLTEAIRAAKAILGELPVPLVIPDAGYVLPDPAG